MFINRIIDLNIHQLHTCTGMFDFDVQTINSHRFCKLSISMNWSTKKERERADTNQSSENCVTLFWTPLNIRSNTNTTIHHILHLHLHQLIYLDVFKTHFLYYRDYSIAKSKPKNFDNYFCCDKKTHTLIYNYNILNINSIYRKLMNWNGDKKT